MRMGLNFKFGNMIVNRDLILLLLLGGFYSLGIFLSNTFVNVYLWKQSESYLTIALYNLGAYVFQLITFIVAGKLAKKLDRVIVIRIGIIFLALFFLAVLFSGEYVKHFSFILGCLIGIGYGFYWLAFNVLTFEITEPDTRDFFNGFLGVLESLGGMIGPIAGGFIISKLADNTGYTVIFSISFSLFICAIVTSFFLRKRCAKGDYDLRTVLKERKYNKNWEMILHAHFVQGLREGIFFFIITVWVFTLVKDELVLGTFNLILSGSSLVTYFLVTKFIKEQFRKQAILSAGIILYLAIFLIISDHGVPHVFIYAFVVGGIFPLLHVPYLSLTYDVIGKARDISRLRIEYIVGREMYLNFGRIVSTTIFIILILQYNSLNMIPVALLVFGLGHTFIYFFIRWIQPTISQSEQDNETEIILDEKNR